MTDSGFDLERLRLETARRLPAGCFDEFQRLSKTLIYGPAFQWLLIDAADERNRKIVMAALDKLLSTAKLRVSHLSVGRRIEDVDALEARLLQHAARSEVINVIVPVNWFNAARWDAFNVRRERIAAKARAKLVFWLDPEAIAAASRGAPDLWAWRSGVYTFVPAPQVSEIGAGLPQIEHAPAIEGFTPDTRSMAERHRRIAEIETWVATHPQASDELLVAPLDELGRLYETVGDYNAALRHLREVELALHRRRDDVLAIAITQGKIADLLEVRGQLGEALRIRREESLPVYERLGDVRSVAITQGKIADILRARGELVEALRIQRDEVLPVVDRLGDVKGRAVTQGKIADILQTRGQLDEALRIRREEQVPVYQRLGDVRSLAITQGKIAGILEARGQLDEALRIRREDELPVYQRLGDIGSLAITQGEIADILQVRGQLDEALQIRRKQELPVYERLGAVRSLAITQNKIADILQARGQLDEALRIRREKVLPVLERLGDERSLLFGRLSLAIDLDKRGRAEDRAEIHALLHQAMAAAERMNLPEVDNIRGLITRTFGSDDHDALSIS